jgi:hypothetical protein
MYIPILFKALFSVLFLIKFGRNIDSISRAFTMAFDKLVRFEHNGEVSYGNLVGSADGKFQVTKLEGGISEGFRPAGDPIFLVEKVLISNFYVLFSLEYPNRNLTLHMCA